MREKDVTKTCFCLFLEGFRRGVSCALAESGYCLALSEAGVREKDVKTTRFSLFLEGFRRGVHCALAESALSGALGG